VKTRFMIRMTENLNRQVLPLSGKNHLWRSPVKPATGASPNPSC
jgi:hypothetical protein